MNWIDGQLPEPNAPEPAPSDNLFVRIIRFPATLIVIGFVLYIVGQGSAGFLRYIMLGEHTGSYPFFDGKPFDLAYGIFAALMAVLAYRVVTLIEDKPFTDFATWRWKRELSGGLILGAGLMAIITGFVAMMGNYHISGWGHAGWGGLAAMLGLAISSGVGEEILFRGILFRLVEQMFGSWAALGVSAVIFGLLHIGNANATWFSSAAIAVEAGIMLGAIYMLTRRLWAAIGLHAAWNFVQGWVFDIPVSGNATPALVDAHVSGSTWMTGGAFGLEASVPALIVATAAGLAILRLAVQRGQVRQPMWVKDDRAKPLPPSATPPTVGS